MSTKKLSYLLAALTFVALPVAAFAAASSTSFILDPSQNVQSVHKRSTSSTFILDGSIDPIVGKSTSTSFSNESGDAFSFYCGDGFRDASETCDGSDLNGATCASQGFDSGSLTCSSSCALVTTTCVARGGGGGGGGGGVASSGVPAAPTLLSSISVKTFSYKASPTLAGTRDSNTTEVDVNGKTTGVTFPSTTTWQAVVALAYGANTFQIIAKNSSGVSSDPVTYALTRRLPGDSNGDNVIDDYDLSKLAKLWGSSDTSGDFNEDGKVNDYDFSMMVARWGAKV